MSDLSEHVNLPTEITTEESPEASIAICESTLQNTEEAVSRSKLPQPKEFTHEHGEIRPEVDPDAEINANGAVEKLNVSDVTKPAADYLSDVTQGYILRIKQCLAEAKSYEDERDRNESAARRKRIEAARCMAKVVASGAMTREKLYKEVLGGASRKNGATYFDLAECYEGIDDAELDRRQADGRLLSLNQSHALSKEASKIVDGDEKKRLIAKVRDDSDLLNPDFGPKAIELLAGGLSGEENLLRQKLGIEQDNIDALRETTRWLPTYEAQFDANQIVVKAATLPLFFAALSNAPENAIKAIEFFATPGEFVITRKEK